MVCPLVVDLLYRHPTARSWGIRASLFWTEAHGGVGFKNEGWLPSSYRLLALMSEEGMSPLPFGCSCVLSNTSCLFVSSENQEDPPQQTEKMLNPRGKKKKDRFVKTEKPQADSNACPLMRLWGSSGGGSLRGRHSVPKVEA